MPTVSKKQHDFMRRVAADENFAKQNNITQEVAREFLMADRLEAQCILHHSLDGWLEEKDELIWVTGTEHANVEALVKKLSDVWEGQLFDLDKQVNQVAGSKNKEASITDITDNVLDKISNIDKDRIVVFGYQVPFFLERAHSVVILDLSRIKSSKRDPLKINRENNSMALYDLSKKTLAKEIKRLSKAGKHDDKVIKDLLQYDPNAKIPTVSNESLLPSAQW